MQKRKSLIIIPVLSLSLLLCSSVVTYGAWLETSGGEWKNTNDSAIGYSIGWQQIDGKWYYFNEEGYMRTNSWVDNYYVGADGAMIINSITPDGYYVGADGSWITTETDSLASVVIADRILNNDVKDASGKTIAILKFTYPGISTGNSSIDSNLNTYFDNYINQIPLKEKTKKNGDWPYPEEVTITYETNLNNGRVLGITTQEFYFDHGMHGTAIFKEHNLDVKTGKVLSLNEITYDNQSFQMFAKQYILKLINTTSHKQLFTGSPGGNYTDIISEYDLSTNWRFDESGISFIFNAYEIGPFSSGPFTFTIPYLDVAPYLNEYGKGYCAV